MKYISYKDAAKFSNIIVDGYATSNTVLTLSHWPGSNTPQSFLADTSAEIVFNYLNSSGMQINAEVVSNNHFDEDGLIGIFSLLYPEFAMEHKDLLCDAANAGDFGIFRDIKAARIVFLIQSFSQKETSPLPPGIFLKNYPEQCSLLYSRLLELIPEFIRNLESYELYYSNEEKKMLDTFRHVDAGEIVIEEYPDMDLSVVNISKTVFDVHHMAIHTRTPSSRMIYIHGDKSWFQYRYESWVQYHSRKVPARIDLSDLARKWNLEEKGKWIFEGINEITPSLYFNGEKSRVNSGEIIESLKNIFLK